MSDLVERVARAILETQRHYRLPTSEQYARAAIAAMRDEPTRAMLDAAYEAWNNPISFADVWHAMIDAALEEKEMRC